MTLLATFKHISSKNADYGAAEAYLTFEHDEFTMKPTLDENGRLIPREDYRISSLNCGGEDFAVACMRANLRYEKNQKREDVKSHHYIISFDPRDGTDNGLTVDRAQELGEQFCKEHFPGHQALICTHPDGHNHSGNIHVHIVINSLRIYEVPLLPYMDRPADTREGCKHRCTNAAMEYFKSEVMEMCHREGLYQIDLLSGSKERITEREYWAAKKGQLALDKENAVREAAGQPTKPTKFETDKAKLRRTIRQALSQAGSFDEFSSLLLREGVTVKESRGRLSYLTPDRTKPITARKLGDDFDKAAVLVLLTQNAHRAAEQSKAILEYPAAVKKLSQGEKTTKTTPADNTLQRMVDREAKRAEGKGVGYDRCGKAQPKANGSYRYRLSAVRLFLPGGTGRSLFCRLCRHAGKPCVVEAGGKDAEREKGAATAGACLFQDPPCPGRAETAEKRQSKSSLPSEVRKRLYHSRRSRPLFQGKRHFQAAEL